MSKGEVFLLSENPLLARWCLLELSGECDFDADLTQVYAHLLNMTKLPNCVLVDYRFCDEQSLVEIYDYITNVLGIPLVIIFSEGKNRIIKGREIFPKAYFATVFSEGGRLRSLLRDVVWRSWESLPRELPKRSPVRSLKAFDETAFNLKLECIAKSREPVLLLGESGSGKSVTARKIHELSEFKCGPFCSMNVAELSSSLAESQLFGTVRGAFTDAQDAPGLFEQAEKGTLLLDEIAELDLAIQSKILTVIETKKFRRVGSMKELSFNTRLVFATNADLAERAKRGLFRFDLLYRIDVLSVQVPPLRDHKEDIPRIACECARRLNKSLSSSALERLSVFSWPGNIRQLCNYVSRACTLSHSQVLTADDFDFF